MSDYYWSPQNQLPQKRARLAEPKPSGSWIGAQPQPSGSGIRAGPQPSGSGTGAEPLPSGGRSITPVPCTLLKIVSEQEVVAPEKFLLAFIPDSLIYPSTVLHLEMPQYPHPNYSTSETIPKTAPPPLISPKLEMLVGPPDGVYDEASLAQLQKITVQKKKGIRRGKNSYKKK